MIDKGGTALRHQLTGIFLCVQTTAQSFPLTATLVKPSDVIALKAYSTWYSLPSGEKTVCAGGSMMSTVLSEG